MKVIPVFDSMTVINHIVWGLTKVDDGYFLYSDYGDSGIRPMAFLLTSDPDVRLHFHHDDKGNHIGVMNEDGGYDDVPLSPEEPFRSCFCDFIKK